MASDEEMLDVSFPRQYMSLSNVRNTFSDPEETVPGERLHAPSRSEKDDERKRLRGTYDEYDTVDWVKDLNADSDRRARMEQRAKTSSTAFAYKASLYYFN
ncbi:unnamed protein product [Hydatigera taeniaeformis]|uniref:Btz domain-containing protein n=1 Tax=Hydatigena taeniaeformis TaxID=6205 RepID=A0A0R3WRQ2_HYDTA|nr:unnamed protein product [Hydatigera taeniaeformis]